MQFKQNPLKRDDVENATYYAKQRIDAVSRFALSCLRDDQKKERHEKCLCPVCYYESSRWGGAAITDTTCSVCQKEMNFSNTNTDKLCEDCAKKHDLCRHCGAGIDLKVSRSLDL